MSPENNTSPEKPSESLFTQEIQRLIDDAPHHNERQLARIISEGLIQDITEAAQTGKLYTKVENAATEEKELVFFSVEDMFLGQLNVALEEQDRQPNNPGAWEVNIPRANGLRDALMTVMLNRHLKEPFRHAVYAEQLKLRQQAEERRRAESAKPELITHVPEHLFEKVTEELGEEGVEAAGVEVHVSTAQRIVDLERPAEALQPDDTEVEQEKDPYDYLRKVLPPVVRPPKSGDATPKVEFGQHVSRTAEDEARQYYDRFVTDENRAAAHEVLMGRYLNPDIRRVLNEHGLASGDMESVDAIREDPEVRFAVAKVLAEKLDKILEYPNKLGGRINFPNKQLKTDHELNKKYTSQDYAILMALKMLGGEFAKNRPGVTDKIELNGRGEAIQGQHRHAAETLLFGSIY